jgi:cytochrome bd-type quinol oxidase subunit 2
MADALFVLMRWLHFVSMATLVGGILFGRLVMTTSAGALAADTREKFGERAASAYRPLVLAAMGGLIVSGTYNLLTNPGHTPKYHMLLGIKLMLVLHVFAVALLITQPKNPKRTRMMTGTLISGLIIIAISAYLRRIF